MGQTPGGQSPQFNVTAPQNDLTALYDAAVAAHLAYIREFTSNLNGYNEVTLNDLRGQYLAKQQELQEKIDQNNEEQKKYSDDLNQETEKHLRQARLALLQDIKTIDKSTAEFKLLQGRDSAKETLNEVRENSSGKIDTFNQMLGLHGNAMLTNKLKLESSREANIFGLTDSAQLTTLCKALQDNFSELQDDRKTLIDNINALYQDIVNPDLDSEEQKKLNERLLSLEFEIEKFNAQIQRVNRRDIALPAEWTPKIKKGNRGYIEHQQQVKRAMKITDQFQICKANYIAHHGAVSYPKANVEMKTFDGIVDSSKKKGEISMRKPGLGKTYNFVNGSGGKLLKKADKGTYEKLKAKEKIINKGLEEVNKIVCREFIERINNDPDLAHLKRKLADHGFEIKFEDHRKLVIKQNGKNINLNSNEGKAFQEAFKEHFKQNAQRIANEVFAGEGLLVNMKTGVGQPRNLPKPDSAPAAADNQKRRSRAFTAPDVQLADASPYSRRSRANSVYSQYGLESRRVSLNRSNSRSGESRNHLSAQQYRPMQPAHYDRNENNLDGGKKEQAHAADEYGNMLKGLDNNEYGTLKIKDGSSASLQSKPYSNFEGGKYQLANDSYGSMPTSPYNDDQRAGRAASDYNTTKILKTANDMSVDNAPAKQAQGYSEPSTNPHHRNEAWEYDRVDTTGTSKLHAQAFNNARNNTNINNPISGYSDLKQTAKRYENEEHFREEHRTKPK